jgi:hypothetical protein
LVGLHDAGELSLLVFAQEHAPGFLDPDDLGLRLLVDFDKGAAGDQHLVLQGVLQVADGAFLSVGSERIGRVEEALEVGHEGEQEDRLAVLHGLALELRARDHALDDVVGEFVEVGAHVEEAVHNFKIFIELQRDALEV